MHVDSVEVQFGDDGVVVARARIDVENLEPQRPVGLRAVVVAERAHVESLERAAVLQGKCGNGLAVTVHTQPLYPRVRPPYLLVLDVPAQNLHLRDTRAATFECVRQALAYAFPLGGPNRLVVEVVGIPGLVAERPDAPMRCRWLEAATLFTLPPQYQLQLQP